MNGRVKFTLRVWGIALMVSSFLGLGIQLVAAATPSAEVAPTTLVLDYLLAEAPEIQAMARKNPANRLVLSVESAPNPQATERIEREFYRVYVGFNIQDGGPGHQSRWATFLVHQDRTEILWANYLNPNSYVPLSDWRKYVNAPLVAGVNDWMCIPFLRVGPIQPHSSIDELVRIFGSDNVLKKTVYGAEGTEKFEASLIFQGTPNELIVFWQDNKYGTMPSAVSIRRQGAEWKTIQDIQIGTSLVELNTINRRPFSFYGFGWDYGGSIPVQWNDGAMSSVKGLFIVLRETRDLPRQYYGDKKLSSDMEALLPDAARVSRIDIQLR